MLYKRGGGQKNWTRHKERLEKLAGLQDTTNKNPHTNTCEAKAGKEPLHKAPQEDEKRSL